MEAFLGRLFILEGVIFAVLGILFFFNPLDSIITLSNLVAILLIFVGIISTVKKPRKIFASVIDIMFGLILLYMQTYSSNILITLYGAWSLVRGIYLLFVSVNTVGEFTKYNLMYSAITIALGALILSNPVLDFLSMPYVIGVYFIVTSVSELYIGMNVYGRIYLDKQA